MSGSVIATWGRMVKFSHSVFALPFALSGAVLATVETRITASQIFWIVTMLSALAFGVVHVIPAPMLFGLKAVSEMPLALVSEFILLNGIVSVLCAYYFRKFGFLAAVGIHFWTDVIWHVVGGLA